MIASEPKEAGPVAIEMLIQNGLDQTIQRAVLWALSQPDVRTVIVVDDGSTNDTAVRAKQM
jgi:hypothetical protein